MLFSFLPFSLSDNYGVEYSKDGRILISTPSELKDVIIPKECEIINGGDSYLKSSFIKSANSIRTIKFESESRLKTIYPYVFFKTSLVSIDMSNCNHLTELNYCLFAQSRQLNEIILPEGLKTIKSGSLSSLDSLTTLSIPDSVTLIEDFNPTYGGSIQSPISRILISENSNLEKIGVDCFYNAHLTDFYIPRNLSVIESAFFNSGISNILIHNENKFFRFDGQFLLSFDNSTICYFAETGNANVEIPATVRFIAPSAARNSHIESVTFNGKIESIEKFAFSGSHIVNFVFPDGLETIKYSLLRSCLKLTTVTMSNNVKVISRYAFSNCPLLSSININEGIEEIFDYAFSQCLSLQTFKCPKSLTYFGDGVFSGCNEIKFDSNGNEKFSMQNNVLYVDKKFAKEFFGNSGGVIIPHYCTNISASIFDHKNITSVTIQSNVSLQIGEKAFFCSKISSIELPECLVSIGESCFEGIRTLTSVKFSKASKLTQIPIKCFKDCTELKEITLPSSLEEIGKMAFYVCSSIISVDFKATSIKTIGNRAFYLSQFISAEFPSSLEYIGEECFLSSKIRTVKMAENNMDAVQVATFKYCTELENITLSNSIATIGTFAFSHCDSLLTFSLPQSIYNVQDNAFEYCYNLATVAIPLDCDLVIKSQVFLRCDKLIKFEVQEEDTKFCFEDGILLNKNKTDIIVFLPSSKKTIYVVPATIENIRNYAFQCCRNLRTVVIPDGKIKSLGYQSFDRCISLSSLYLPKELTNFGEFCFSNCPKLNKCGTVVYENLNKTNAIRAGIPELAFNLDCSIVEISHCSYSPFFNSFFHISFAFLLLF